MIKPNLKRTFLIILTFIFSSFHSISQTLYAGFIDKYPIEFIENIYSDGVAQALYVYRKFDDPIKLEGTFKNG